MLIIYEYLQYNLTQNLVLLPNFFLKFYTIFPQKHTVATLYIMMIADIDF